jgi:hypothetical protein
MKSFLSGLASSQQKRSYTATVILLTLVSWRWLSTEQARWIGRRLRLRGF